MLGALPMGWLADRYRRGRVIAWASLIFAAMVVLVGLAVNALTLFLARLGVGVAKSNQLPVQGSLLADQYPIGDPWPGRRSRSRSPGGSPARSARCSSAASPPWPAAPPDGGGRSSSSPSRRRSPRSSPSGCPEPPRGQYEKQDVLGEVIEDERPAPISHGGGVLPAAADPHAASRDHRLRRHGLRAVHRAGAGQPVPGGQYGLGSFGRGVGRRPSAGCACSSRSRSWASYYDGLYRRDPAKALRLHRA